MDHFGIIHWTKIDDDTIQVWMLKNDIRTVISSVVNTAVSIPVMAFTNSAVAKALPAIIPVDATATNKFIHNIGGKIISLAATEAATGSITNMLALPSPTDDECPFDED